MNLETLTRLPYLWHNVPAAMRGAKLWPLRALAQIEPEIAALYKSKYVGREHIAQLHVPLLDCLWDEVVFLSPIHPQILNETMHEAGCKVASKQVFQINTAALREHEAVWFDPKKSGNNGELLPNSVRPLDWEAYRSEALSEAAAPYYRRCAANGRSPLILGTENHVLVRGYKRDGQPHPIDVTHAEIITTTVPPQQRQCR